MSSTCYTMDPVEDELEEVVIDELDGVVLSAPDLAVDRGVVDIISSVVVVE